jgi:hypothetical protein
VKRVFVFGAENLNFDEIKVDDFMFQGRVLAWNDSQVIDYTFSSIFSSLVS